MTTELEFKEGVELNFFDLFRTYQYKIEIPIIQRDYAQGRENKAKVRETFLNALRNSLTEESPISLDFVYGTVNNGKFIPLDGQQRLTTLFLLHWYAAQKEQKSADFAAFVLKGRDSKFTYKTRPSSKEFCDALMKTSINLKELLDDGGNSKGALSKTIKNASWYYLSWRTDPTIKGMLTMLDAIHYKFHDIENLYNKLTDESNPIITFQFLNLPSFNLSDDLYIKMNARGKPLTEFENFKAQFIKLLEVHSDEIQKEFAAKIDGQWCDLFWDFSVQHPKGPTFKIDEQLLAFFDFITEMLLYKDFGKPKNEYDFEDFSFVEQVYGKEKESNVVFLMNSLDLLSAKSSANFKATVHSFFTNLFSRNQKNGLVRLFDDNVNLFENLVYHDKLENIEKLLFYAIFYYHISVGAAKLEVSDNLKNYLRICRNFLLKIKQRGNSSRKNQFESNLRDTDYQSVIQTFEIIFDKEDVYGELPSKLEVFKFRKANIQGEIIKAKLIKKDRENAIPIFQLEDHEYLKGELHVFGKILENKTDLQALSKNFFDIFGVLPDGLIIRSLLSIGDYSVHIGNCYFGKLQFFGGRENWHRILADNGSKVSNIIVKYFNGIKEVSEKKLEEKLAMLINKKSKEDEKHAWLNLFIKYPIITEGRYLIYSFPTHEQEHLEIEKIEGTSLRSYHMNCFIEAVMISNELSESVKSEFTESRGGEPSFITLKHSAFMTPLMNFWYIDAKSQDFSILVDKFNLQPNDSDNTYKLFPTKDKDFVEIAVDFLNAVYA